MTFSRVLLLSTGDSSYILIVIMLGIAFLGHKPNYIYIKVSKCALMERTFLAGALCNNAQLYALSPDNVANEPSC
jgi:hypothetical protein